MMHSVSRRAVAGVAMIAATTLAMLAMSACTSTSKHNTTPTTPTTPKSPTASAATRWWSNAAVTVGSTIAPDNPAEAASRLQPSKDDYCGMLRQTLGAQSVLAGLQAGDTKLLVSVQAFVAEIEKVAPTSVAPSWQLLGPVIIGVVKSGATSAPSINTAANLQAAQTVNSDAQAECGLDLTKVLTGASK